MDKKEVVKKVHALMNDKNNYTSRLQAEEIVENYAEAKAGPHETIVMWRDVNDELPDKRGEYLTVNFNEARGGRTVNVGFYDPKTMTDWEGINSWVTHWAELPKLPPEAGQHETIVMRTGYLCEVGGTRTFVIADNVAGAMDCLERTSNGEDYSMLIHHSIPVILDA